MDGGLAIPFQGIKTLLHIHVPRIAMRDHRPDGIACEAAEITEPALDQGARFPAFVRSAFLGEDADDIHHQGVALFWNQTDVSADGAFRHVAILWSTL